MNTKSESGFSGSEMSKIDTIKDGFIEIQDGIITAFGSMDQWTGIDDWNNTEIIDANRRNGIPILL